MITDLILGTAGHIDHGKTSLIKALTGVETDRLPEEKRRGITIELGFAELALGDYRLGVVDVPGHEKFVRNMLAGATSMDIAMLVVAADDSVKTQTREHLEILRLLDLQAGIIVLTKCDLADEDWTDLVEEEVRELVSDTFLAEAPIVRTSSETGQGIEELQNALLSAAEQVVKSREAQSGESPFRLAIDRSFTMAGHGTIVTGSVASGQAKLGDQLVIEPGRVEVRIRGLQNHDRTVEEIHRGQRAAINLAGVRHQDIHRGQELSSPGHLTPSRLLTVSVILGSEAPRPLKNRSRVRIHLGTAEILCSVVLLDQDRLEPGETALAQFFLSEPAVAIWNQPFVIRSESPVLTIGGGKILDPEAEKIRRPSEQVIQLIRDLASENPVVRASAALYFSRLRPWHAEDLARTAGIENVHEVHQALLDHGDLKQISLTQTRKLNVHRKVLEEICDQIEAALKKLHEENPLRSMLDRSQLNHRFSWLGNSAILDTVLKLMQKEKRVKLSDRGVTLVGQGPQLSAGEQKLLIQIVEKFRQAGLQPPTPKQCQEQATKNQRSVPQLITLAAANGDLVEIAQDFFIHIEHEQQMREVLAREMAPGDGLTMSQIRDFLQTSRKFAVPLCEYLDRIGFTRREGDLRVLAEPTGS